MSAPPRALTPAELIGGVETPSWVKLAHATYRGVLLHPTYPCHFAAKAEGEDRNRYSYVCAGERDHLPDVLRSFIDHSRAHARERGVLIVFYERDERERTLAEDETRFWELLGWLHKQDREPWPDDVPSDAEDPFWEYCFGGDPMFVFPCSPAYRSRVSRRTGPYFMVCFQPRRVFHGIERGTPVRELSHDQIWSRMRTYDGVDPHPEVEHLAICEPRTREWKLCVVPDENTPLGGECPFRASTA